MASDRTERTAEAARQAAERRKTGGASAPSGAPKTPGGVQAPGGAPEEEADRRPSHVVPEPTPEDAPELLGERSDYPAPRGEDAED